LEKDNQELMKKMNILSDKMKALNELYEDFTKSREEERNNIIEVENTNKVIFLLQKGTFKKTE